MKQTKVQTRKNEKANWDLKFKKKTREKNLLLKMSQLYVVWYGFNEIFTISVVIIIF